MAFLFGLHIRKIVIVLGWYVGRDPSGPGNFGGFFRLLSVFVQAFLGHITIFHR